VLFFEATGELERAHPLSSFDVSEIRDLDLETLGSLTPACSLGDLDGDDTIEVLLWDGSSQQVMTGELNTPEALYISVSLDASANVVARRVSNVPLGFRVSACFGDRDDDGKVEIIGSEKVFEIDSDFQVSFEGPFPGHLANIVQIGDVDQDGIGDLATCQNALLRILYLNPDGTVREFTDVDEGWGRRLG